MIARSGEGRLARPGRAARGAYARSIRAQLHAIGIDDLPRNGAFIRAGIDAPGGSRPDLPADLGVTKQAVSQLTDTLVSRGYLERSPDPGDRRRIALALTERGQRVVAAVNRGVRAVDLQLHERVPAGQVDAMRAGLLALAEIKSASETAGTGRRRPTRQLRSFSPIFPVRDLAAALAHYSALGFETLAYEGGGDYGFADREGTGLHLAPDAGTVSSSNHIPPSARQRKCRVLPAGAVTTALRVPFARRRSGWVKGLQRVRATGRRVAPDRRT